MKKIIVDTNIIFSFLLQSKGSIGDLISNSEGMLEFYGCAYMRLEIHKHWPKLLRISKLTDPQLRIIYDQLLSRLTFINEELISDAIWQKAESIVSEIDVDDIDFVALTQYLKGILWTGDKALYQGLKVKRFRSVYNTQDMLRLHKRLSR